MSNNLNLKVINFQNPLRSKPVREDFSDIQTEFNSLKSEVDNLSASTSTSEIISSRDAYSELYTRLRSQAKLFGNGVMTNDRVLDDCETLTNWSAGTGATALALDSVNYVEGTYSIKFGKSTTTDTEVEYGNDFANTNFENRYIYFNIRIADQTTLDKLSNYYFDITPDTDFITNYKRWDFINDLTIGWNKIKIEANSPDSTTGTVNDTDTIFIGRWVIKTNNITDVITSGDIGIDYVFYIGTELKIKAQDTPDMTVKILTGNAIINGYGISKTSSESSGTITAPSSDPRWDLVTVDVNNSLRIYGGEEAASPAVPPIPLNNIPLAKIYNRVGETSIKNTDDSTNGYIVDLRLLQSDVNRFYFNDAMPSTIIIKNQSQFEFYFGTGTETGSGLTSGGWSYNVSGGVITVTIPEDTTIFLEPCQTGGTTTSYNGKRAYILKTQIELLSRIAQIGFNEDLTVVVKDDGSSFEDDIKFYTDSAGGADVTGSVTSVEDDATKARFVSVGHGLEVGNEVVHTGFSIGAYNGTYTINAKTNDTYTIYAIVFSATDTGSWRSSNILSASGAVFTMKNSVEAIENFSIGDLIHSDYDNTFYNITDITGANVTVDRNIVDAGSYTGDESLRSMITDIYMEGWSFDGRGGVDGLGGSIVGTGKNGGAFNIPYCGESEINCKIINHKVANFGGGVYGGDNQCFHLIIEKVHNCFCSDSDYGNGGGVSGCNNSIITTCFCSASNTGGETIEGGGGVFNCDYSIINVYNSASPYGGGVSNCDYSIINAYNCKSTSYGGGALYCDYSIINAYNCSGYEGGGAHSCDYSTIKAYDCVADYGDIAHSCSDCESIWGNSGTIVSCTLGGVRQT